MSFRYQAGVVSINRPPGSRRAHETRHSEDTMTTTPGNASTHLPGKPPVVDLATWQAAREELLVREKAHTHEGDAIAAARRRLPMVELDGTVEVTGQDGPVPFLDLFQGRDELVVYKHMWYDGAPYQGQCEGCTTTAWHVKDAVYLNARGVSFAVLTSGPWDEVAPYVEFMGYTQPWYSVRGLEAPHRVPRLGVTHELDVRGHLVPRARGQDGKRDAPGVEVDGVLHVPGRGGATLAL